ncbi:calcium-translocating P-type ATPase, PMCA-type [Hahella sp. CCB-MM4]|uniref:calcium-translocating P-type ATPase, PMCA-type n=1 Tax=Hahella sp. (strain CCB-MM4) TaxID=1926491 RepID=UPI000B9B0D90|nr:calcium-translocating P-type ATPase, PMCA-type [Hahella sp. CCB-MM4]OZG69787.1 calcium-translocating P-type ATPase, PMCA-type [Hahella sp. CCB-MM4]
MPGQWHTQTPEAVLRQLNTASGGLESIEAQRRISQFGENRIPDSRKQTLFSMFIRQFADVMILVLLAAAVISGVVGDVEDTLAILCIVLINALIGASQQYRAEKAVAALREMSAPDAQVHRDSRLQTLAAVLLVPGDIVELEAGNQIPADLRLISAEQLEVDESALTGESHTVSKDVDALTDDNAPIGDRINMAYKSTLVTKGKARGVVVDTGLNTQVGQIAALLQAHKEAKTPLQVRLASFGRYLALAVIGICALVFVAGLLQGQPILLMFLTAVSLAVAAIPEALPAVVTISLALGAHKLIRQNALVRNLPAVETLGSVTYICTDKTGTLTLNKMTAERIVSLEGEGADMGFMAPALRSACGTILALNNDMSERNGELTGEPTEQALYDLAVDNGFEKEELSRIYPRIKSLTFDSIRKMMTTVHRDDTGYLALVKGAPEVVIPRCNQAAVGEGEQLFSRLFTNKQAVLDQVDQLARDGYRVLALARKRVAGELRPENEDSLEENLTFIALVVLVDPPRDEAPAAVRDCHTAGITPVMITGDHPATAHAIARRLGISTEQDKAITGAELASISDERLLETVRDIRVYARVSPEQKLRIVKALQHQGEFVAMTGDGVNDAPAIKHANIGIAMGMKGTDVARGAADMVLLDDNFSTIVNAVRAGRRIFDNIRKFISYTMSSNSGEIWTLFLAPFLGLPIPLLPIHILWINIVTDGLPGLAYTAEPADSNVMERKPRAPDESIFAHGMWQHIIWVGLLIGGLSIGSQAWAIAKGAEYWQTVVFTVLTLSQLFHALAVRSESVSLFTQGLFSNRAMLLAVGLTILLQLAVIYVPLLNNIFHTKPIPLSDLIVCFAISSIVLWAVEIEKWLIRRKWIYGEVKIDVSHLSVRP